MTPGTAAVLAGKVTSAGAPPAILWRLYSGPGTVTFGDAAQPGTTASFSTAGVYTLLLSADDAVHAVAYDAVVVTVAAGLHVNATRSAGGLQLTWSGAAPPYVIERTDVLPAAAWTPVFTNAARSGFVASGAVSAFYRVRGQ